jgi:ATP-dependent Clp protease ATP-binding subunit ClpA
MSHEYVGVDHLFWGLLAQQETQEALNALGVTPSLLITEVESFLSEALPSLPQAIAQNPSMSIGCHQLLEQAKLQAMSAHAEEVNCLNVLIAVYYLEESFAAYLLKSAGISQLDLKREHARLADLSLDDFDDEELFAEGDEGGEEGSFNFADVVQDLTEAAREGRLDPMVGRVKELERLVHVLCRRRKNNPLLVGEAGVGKTAIVEGLALAVHQGEVPEPLQNAIIYSLDVGSLVAGTRYRGDFEARIKKVLKRLKEEPNAVLFIDEIHTFIGAGAVNGGSLDASAIIKPMLARGELRCIGATTWQEFRNVFEKDQAFSRRFQKVEVNEPSVDECVEIMKGLRPHYEGFHHVKYSDESLLTAARLSSRHFHDRFLPDKAIDVMDEAGAEARIATRPTVEEEHIEATIARMAGVPAKQVSTNDRDQLKRLEPDLKGVVFGQDEAVGQLVAAIKLARSGLGNPTQPIGSFMFTGPTGVGKTEVARQLAKTLGLQLVRFDMSEYMERHTVSRLIGAPPGYVGYDQGGLLTDAIAKTPHCVLLLDELEKAHPEVFNILLQVMDHGTLTDNNGKRSDFRNVILIMTSNVGAQEAQRRRPGFFKSTQEQLSDEGEAFKRTFSPEFRNRLHARVRFAPLSRDVCLMIAEKLSKELITQLQEREVEARFTHNAIAQVARLGYDPLNGARPMQRVLREHIKRLLADELLFGALAEGGALLIDAPKPPAEGDTQEVQNKEEAPKTGEGTLFTPLYNEEARAHPAWAEVETLSLALTSPAQEA